MCQHVRLNGQIINGVFLFSSLSFHNNTLFLSTYFKVWKENARIYPTEHPSYIVDAEAAATRIAQKNQHKNANLLNKFHCGSNCVCVCVANFVQA